MKVLPFGIRVFISTFLLFFLYQGSVAYADSIRECWIHDTPWGPTQECRVRYVPDPYWGPGPWTSWQQPTWQSWQQPTYQQCHRVCFSKHFCIRECDN